MSELKLSEVLNDNDSFRFDGEYFKKEYLSKLSKIQEHEFKYVGDCSFVTDGIHESIQFDESSNIRLISAKAPKENIFDLSGLENISKLQNSKNPRTELKENDVIISTVGTIGNCAVVTKEILPANSDRHVGIIRIENSFSPYFLSTFFLSKYGRFQSLRESTGNVQLNLFIYKIKKLKIPLLSKPFQEGIESLVKTAHSKLEESKSLYKEAEDLLLDELGLLPPNPLERGNSEIQCFSSSFQGGGGGKKEGLGVRQYSIKSFKESFLSSGRLDAEYYQPKYDWIIERIKSKPYKKLSGESGIAKIKKSIEPGSNAYKEEGIPFVRISDLTKFEIKHPEIHISKELIPNINELKPKKNTILLSKDGTVGIAHKAQEDLNIIVSGGILLLTICDSSINPDYLTLVLNSPLVQLQAERDAGGSIIQHWKPSEISEVVIPILSQTIQSQISEKVQKSFNLRRESKELLELAKRAVEVAIEDGEDKGLVLISNLFHSNT